MASKSDAWRAIMRIRDFLAKEDDGFEEPDMFTEATVWGIAAVILCTLCFWAAIVALLPTLFY
jgi:hypothetical protein